MRYRFFPAEKLQKPHFTQLIIDINIGVMLNICIKCIWIKVKHNTLSISCEHCFPLREQDFFSGTEILTEYTGFVKQHMIS